MNSNYLNPEYRFDGGRTSYDEIQYAYMECLDSDGKNLLVKFSGLDIYSENDDSYAVMVVAENGGNSISSINMIIGQEVIIVHIKTDRLPVTVQAEQETMAVAWMWFYQMETMHRFIKWRR